MAIEEIEDFEEQVELIEKENKKLLSAFKKGLKEKGLTEKTIRNHIDNVDFYINDFLCYYEPTNAQEGCSGYAINRFLGDWFIRKAMWSSPAQVKSNAASIKKFYGWMLEATDLIDKFDYEDLCDEIKSEMTTWQENAEIDEDDYIW